MLIQIFENKDQAAVAGAALIATQILDEPESVLGFATGTTPLGIYAELVRLFNEGILSFEDVVSFNLDEYYGIKREDPQSYYYFMMENLFSKLNVKEEHVHILHGEAADPEEECRNFEELIAEAGGIDLQLLGIGRNGHIGFNEPSPVFSRVTHKVHLTDDTIDANSRFFGSKELVPKEALSMGIGTIMDARKVVMIVTGENKAEAVRRMLQGDVDPACPASVLQLHQNATLLLDREAASLL